jgi:hypothetical protein
MASLESRDGSARGGGKNSRWLGPDGRAVLHVLLPAGHVATILGGEGVEAREKDVKKNARARRSSAVVQYTYVYTYCTRRATCNVERKYFSKVLSYLRTFIEYLRMTKILKVKISVHM